LIVRESARIGSLKRLDFFSFPHADLGPLPYPYDQPEFEGFDALPAPRFGDVLSYDDDPFLGKSLKKRFEEKIGKKVKKVVKKIVGKKVAKVAKKVGTAIQKAAKKVGKPAMKAFKKYFPKIAPFLAAAVQIFNFIPGLGVALGIAISVGSASMTMTQNLKALKKAKKLSEQEEGAMAAESADLDRQAHESLDAAYDKGETPFTADYGMTRDLWKGLSVEGKTRFLKEAVAIANQKKLDEVGVTPEQFSKMTVEEQDKVLEKAFGTSVWTWVALAGGGVLLVTVLALALKSKKKAPNARA